MPLSEPSAAGGGGFSTDPVIVDVAIKNTGTDTTQNFGRMLWDDVNSQIIVAGDVGYVGTKQYITDKLVAAADTATGDALSICIDELSKGLVFMGNTGVLEISDSSYANFSVITPALVTMLGVFSIAGDNNLYCAISELAGPQRNIAVSADSGATWDTDPGLFAPITSTVYATVQSRDRSLVAVMAQNGGGVAITDDPTGAWYLHTLTGAVQDIRRGCFNDAGTVFVCTDTLGKIWVIENLLANDAVAQIAAANNPFYINSTNGTAIDGIGYVNGVGFIFIAPSGNIVGVMSDDDLTLISQGVYLGTGLTFDNNTSDGAGSIGVADALGNWQACGLSNVAVMRFAT